MNFFMDAERAIKRTCLDALLLVIMRWLRHKLNSQLIIYPYSFRDKKELLAHAYDYI